MAAPADFNREILSPTGPCNNGGSCVERLGSFLCVCANGSTGHRCQYMNTCEISDNCTAGKNIPHLTHMYTLNPHPIPMYTLILPHTHVHPYLTPHTYVYPYATPHTHVHPYPTPYTMYSHTLTPSPCRYCVCGHHWWKVYMCCTASYYQLSSDQGSQY